MSQSELADEFVFSDEIIELYNLICQEDDPDHRATMMIDLAEMFVQSVDVTDHELSEGVHDMVRAVLRDRMYYDQSSMSLARSLMRVLPIFLEKDQTLIESTDIPDSESGSQPN